MKYITKYAPLIGIVCVLLMGSKAHAQQDYTATHVVERIQASTSGVTYLRPVGLGSWGGNTCPNAVYVYIFSTATNYDALLNLAMASKLNGSPIYVQGTCSADGNSFNADYIILL